MIYVGNERSSDANCTVTGVLFFPDTGVFKASQMVSAALNLFYQLGDYTPDTLDSLPLIFTTTISSPAGVVNLYEREKVFEWDRIECIYEK